MKQYTANNFYYCIENYVVPTGEWNRCPRCGLRPKVWIYDNGESTACGCWETMYDHFSIYAESIMSVYRRTHGNRMIEYDDDALRKNWNHFCETGEVFFEYESELNKIG